jgi:hypothetical protein
MFKTVIRTARDIANRMAGRPTSWDGRSALQQLRRALQEAERREAQFM